MLAGAGLGDDFLLAHILREQSFAHAVVQFVGAGVVEVLTLEVDLCTAVVHRHGASVVDGSGPALEVRAEVAKFRNEGSVVLDLVVGLCDLGEGPLELRRQELPAVPSEEPVLVGDTRAPGHLPRTVLLSHVLPSWTLVFVVHPGGVYSIGAHRRPQPLPTAGLPGAWRTALGVGSAPRGSHQVHIDRAGPWRGSAWSGSRVSGCVGCRAGACSPPSIARRFLHVQEHFRSVDHCADRVPPRGAVHILGRGNGGGGVCHWVRGFLPYLAGLPSR